MAENKVENEVECLERLLRSPWLGADMANKCSLVRLRMSRRPPRILARIPIDARLVQITDGDSYSDKDEKEFCDKSRDIRQTTKKLQEIMNKYCLIEYPDEKRQSENAVTLAYGYKQE